MKEIIELPTDSYEDPMSILFEECPRAPTGQNPFYFLVYDDMVFACNEPFTIEDIQEWYAAC